MVYAHKGFEPGQEYELNVSCTYWDITFYKLISIQ